MNPWISTLFFFVFVGVGSVALFFAAGAVLLVLEKLYRAIGNPGGLLRDYPGPRPRGVGEGYYDNPGGPG